ncbi:MAG: hypothetical protein LUG96_07065 [Tannerellaceae bacterium]|nr:hypothetical protein [Tannerellaceae bacterium]MCC8199794.1 hypothetical protein [Tannerellaceae bacterium]MCD7915034.1 hypothetical protein [Tannerellaceae bacterium]
MNEFVKYAGVLVLLIGVLILAVPALTGGMTNTLLLTGLGVILLGYIGHIVINKKAE